MWYRLVNRKELMDFFLSPFGERSDSKISFSTSIPKSFATNDSILLGWGKNPSKHPSLPCLAVTNDADLPDLLAYLNANPQGPSPITAFCRFISKEDFLEYSEPSLFDLESPHLTPFIALSYVESLVLSDRQIRLTDLSPAMCQRTLSFTWAKAVAAKVPFNQLGSIVEAWIACYGMTGDNHRAARVEETVSALFSVLRVVTGLLLGSAGESPEESFCRALLDRSKQEQEASWRRLSSELPGIATLTAISEATREERGQLFQQAVRADARPFVLALLAAQISPGTLDHIEIALAQKDPRVAFWYVALASIARPQAMLSFNGALGLKLERLASRLMPLDSFPECDLSYAELRVVARLGLEHLNKRLQHAGELSVELVPTVTALFRFPSRSGRSAEAYDQERSSRDLVNRERQRDRLLAIARSLEEMAHSQQLDIDYSENNPRKSGQRK